jgi:hypothetical protein
LVCADREKNDYRLKSNCDGWKMRGPVPMRSLERHSPRSFTPGRRDRILVRRRRAPPSILVRVARHFLSGFSAFGDAKQIKGELHAPSTGQNKLPEILDMPLGF